jgi:hypothetical protein
VPSPRLWKENDEQFHRRESQPTGKERAAELELYTVEQIPLDQRHARPRDLLTIWFTSDGPVHVTVANLEHEAAEGEPMILAHETRIDSTELRRRTDG